MLETPHPDPVVMALLAACSEAALRVRRGHAELLGAVAALDRSDAYPAGGQPSTSRLLEELLRVDRGQARRLLTQARLLVAPVPDPLHPDAADPVPDLPATADAAAEGAIGPEHVEVIEPTMRRLRRVEPSLPEPVLDETERQLAELARERSPRQLDSAAAEIADRLDPDGVEPHDAERPTEECRLSINRRGECSGRFRFADPETGQAIFDEITTRTPPPDPDGLTTPLRPGRDLPERRAEGLRHLVDDARRVRTYDVDDGDSDDVLCDDCDGPLDTDVTLRLADELADEPGEAARPPEPGPRPRADRPARETTMIVTVPLELLEQRAAERALGVDLGLVDGRYRISAETARRLACDASVVPAVLGSKGEILDLGRRTRTVSTAQRRAVIARDRHCAFPGCRRSPRRCEVHHVVPWSWGGPTDLDQLVLLCSRHHHEVHHSPWAVVMDHGRPTFVPPAYLDPLRRPRANGVHEGLAA